MWARQSNTPRFEVFEQRSYTSDALLKAARGAPCSNRLGAPPGTKAQEDIRLLVVLEQGGPAALPGISVWVHSASSLQAATNSSSRPGTTVHLPELYSWLIRNVLLVGLRGEQYRVHRAHVKSREHAPPPHLFALSQRSRSGSDRKARP
jgi:hypothetical protein